LNQGAGFFYINPGECNCLCSVPALVVDGFDDALWLITGPGDDEVKEVVKPA